MTSYDQRLKIFFAYCVLITFTGFLFIVSAIAEIKQQGGEDPGLAGAVIFIFSIVILLPIFVVITSFIALKRPMEKSKSSGQKLYTTQQEITSVNQFILIFLFLLFTAIISAIVHTIYRSLIN